MREERNLYQKDIANMIGITQSAYAKYENERNDIPTDILILLADYYNTSIDYLLFRTDEIKPLPKSKIK